MYQILSVADTRIAVLSRGRPEKKWVRRQVTETAEGLDHSKFVEVTSFVGIDIEHKRLGVGFTAESGFEQFCSNESPLVLVALRTQYLFDHVLLVAFGHPHIHTLSYCEHGASDAPLGTGQPSAFERQLKQLRAHFVPDAFDQIRKRALAYYPDADDLARMLRTAAELGVLLAIAPDKIRTRYGEQANELLRLLQYVTVCHKSKR